MPGYDVRVLGDAGEELPAGETGHVVVKLPLPPGCLKTLWQNDEGFDRAPKIKISHYDPGYGSKEPK